jgi:nucleotide-binding universal stress UspA family protein
MGRIKRILCALDFSDDTSGIAEYARELAEAVDAGVVVLYVAQSMNRYTLFNVTEAAVKDFVDTVASGARDRMDEAIAKQFEGIRAEGVVDMGYPAEVILSVAEERNCDLIVMGTHGRAGWDRIVFGSVAEKVVKAARVPVLTVPPRK